MLHDIVVGYATMLCRSGSVDCGGADCGGEDLGDFEGLEGLEVDSECGMP